MKNIISLFGMFIMLVAVMYFLVSLSQNWESLGSVDWGMPVVVSVIETGILQCLIVFVGAIAWFLLLKGMNEQVGAMSIMTLFGLTQLAKYLPGNIGHHLGRAVLAEKCGLRISRVIFSIILETSGIIVAAILVTFVALVVSDSGLQFLLLHLEAPWKIILLMIIVCVFPVGTLWLFNRLGIFFLGNRWETDLSLPSRKILLLSFFAYVMSFLTLAFMVIVLGKQAFGVEEISYARVTSIVTVAWLAGYIVPGAPAGIGIREAVMISALTPMWGGPAAVGTSILLRLATTGGEGLIFLAALTQKRHLFPRINVFG